jgi:hypothetical protein
MKRREAEAWKVIRIEVAKNASALDSLTPLLSREAYWARAETI